MHPLPVAQATAVSLHALLPQKRVTSQDEKLVVDAITALHCWAIPDKRSLPIRLRLRRSVPLRIRIRPSSPLEPPLISKRTEHQVPQSGQHRSQASASHSQRQTGLRASTGGQDLGPSIGNAAESISEPSSLENSSGRRANSSDLSTEPPEGWPRLSDLPSPVLQLHSTNPGPEENRHGKKPVVDAELPGKSEGKDVSSTPPSTPRRNRIASSNGLVPHKAPLSPVQPLAKSQSISPASPCMEVRVTAGKRTDKPIEFSQGSTGIADAPSVDGKERKRPFSDAHVLSRKKKRTSNRKNSVPKRRRPTSQNQMINPPLTNICEKNELDEEEAGFEHSPSPNSNDEPLGHPHSSILTPCNRATVSPVTSHTQKYRLRNTDDPAEAHELGNSPGSVVVGSSSYDGCSVDMGFGGTNGTCNDIPSRPSSVAWNESFEESPGESFPSDHRVPPSDTIGKKESELPLESPGPARSRQQSIIITKQGNSSVFPENDVQEQQGADLECLNNQTTSIVTHEGLHQNSHLRKELKDATTGLVASRVGKATHSNERKHSTQSAPHPAIRHHDQDILVGNPANGISPISLEEHAYRPRDEICRYSSGRRSNSISPTEADVDEMIVCITSFPSEIESEMAHEIVMRLGGEVVSSVDSTLPHCVVAPVNLQTKEIASSEMAILLALASRIPVVGMSWLTHCFKSGFWVDFNNFELPSSKARPSVGVFRGIAVTFEDAFSRKNAKRKCLEYRKSVEKLVTLAEGVVVDASDIREIVRKDNKLRLLIRIAYDFENNKTSTTTKELPDTGILMRVVSQTWISACLFSGQCPPP